MNNLSMFDLMSQMAGEELRPIGEEACETDDAELKIVIDTTESVDGMAGLPFLSSPGIGEKTYHKFIGEYSRLPRNSRDNDNASQKPLVIDITTMGGSLTYSMMIANVISRHPGPTIARVTKYAMSGGTIIALACDRLEIARTACLGPIDPHVYGFFSLPVKYVKPVVNRHREKSICCDLLANYLNGLDNSFEKKFLSLLKRKYDECAAWHIYATFYHQCEHNLPIFPEEIPKNMSTTVIDLPVEPDPKKTPCVMPPINFQEYRQEVSDHSMRASEAQISEIYEDNKPASSTIPEPSADSTEPSDMDDSLPPPPNTPNEDDAIPPPPNPADFMGQLLGSQQFRDMASGLMGHLKPLIIPDMEKHQQSTSQEDCPIEIVPNSESETSTSDSD